MSWTKQRRKPKGPAPFQIPRDGEGKTAKYRLEGELLEKFCQLYPITDNLEMARLFGVGFSTMARFHRQLGLKKDMEVITRISIARTVETCRKNGVYARLKGKRPSDACMEAAKKLRSEGFNPIKEFRERKPDEYKRMRAEQGKWRSEMFKRERRRKRLGLPQLTNFNVPEQVFDRNQIQLRCSMKNVCCYILGDYRERYGERWIIYYDRDTKRSKIRERNARKKGFQIRELKD